MLDLDLVCHLYIEDHYCCFPEYFLIHNSLHTPLSYSGGVYTVHCTYCTQTQTNNSQTSPYSAVRNCQKLRCFNHRHIMVTDPCVAPGTKTFSSSKLSFSHSEPCFGELIITISLMRDPSTAWHCVPTSLYADSTTIKTRHFPLEAVSIIHSFLRVSVLSLC